jgi:hypothetical protein
MSQELRDLQASSGATFAESASGVQMPVSFGNDAVALTAVRSHFVLCDRPHWGRLKLSGADKIRFLHNQSTNDFQKLKVGEGWDIALGICVWYYPHPKPLSIPPTPLYALLASFLTIDERSLTSYAPLATSCHPSGG